MMDRPLTTVFYMKFTTRAFATGIPTVLAGTPVLSAYEDNNLTQITAGVALGVDHDSVVGLNLITITPTAGNGFEAGKTYDIVITTGTVGGVSVVGEVVGSFTIESSSATTRMGATGGGLTTLATQTSVNTVDTNVDTLITRLTAARATNLDELGSTNIPADIDTLLTRIIGTLATGTHNPATAAQIAVLSDWIDAGRLDTILDGIKTVTDAQAATGTGLSAIPWNAAWDAEVQSEVADALGVFFTSAAALVDLVWDEIINTGQHNGANSAGRLQRLAADIVLIDSAVDTTIYGASTTVEFGTDLTQVDSFFNDAVIVFTSGALTGQARIIDSYSQTNGVITLDEALTSAPLNNVTFSIKSTHVHSISQTQAGLATEAKQDIIDTNVDDIQTRIPAALVSGRMDSNVSAIDDTAAAAVNLALSTGAIVVGAAATGTLSSTNMTSNLTEATDNHYIGKAILWTSGVLINQVSTITDYIATNGELVFDATETGEAPSNGDGFILI